VGVTLYSSASIVRAENKKQCGPGAPFYLFQAPTPKLSRHSEESCFLAVWGVPKRSEYHFRISSSSRRSGGKRVSACSLAVGLLFSGEREKEIGVLTWYDDTLQQRYDDTLQQRHDDTLQQRTDTYAHKKKNKQDVHTRTHACLLKTHTLAHMNASSPRFPLPICTIAS
jgi:Zn-finger nucleic acid-binding protein